jgi:hypothetical protein
MRLQAWFIDDPKGALRSLHELFAEPGEDTDEPLTRDPDASFGSRVVPFRACGAAGGSSRIRDDATSYPGDAEHDEPRSDPGRGRPARRPLA